MGNRNFALRNRLLFNKISNQWALGAVVSASRLHRVGRGFESLSAHQLRPTPNSAPLRKSFPATVEHGWTWMFLFSIRVDPCPSVVRHFFAAVPRPGVIYLCAEAPPPLHPEAETVFRSARTCS